MNLWYEQPAKSWIEALPIGNGRLGAMVYGNPGEEIISLNEDSLWSGYPKDINPKNKEGYYHKAVELTKEKKYHQAQELIEKELTSGWGQSYMPLGDLVIDFKHEGDISGYCRKLDLETAVATVEYEVDENKYKREIFASAPDNLIVMRIKSDKSASINFSFGFKSQLKSKILVKNNCLILEGEAPSHVEPNYVQNCDNPVVYSDKDEERGMFFMGMAKVISSGGSVICADSNIQVKDADNAVILISAHTSFAGFDVQPYLNGREYEGLCLEELKLAYKKTYEELLSRHVADYKEYYDRVYLDLGENEVSSLPTDKRLYQFKEEENDPALYTLLFQYGRYLLISASREDTQPANLQGIWNNQLRPPWSSNYTININTQMNYWPTFSCSLGEMHQPLVQFIKDLSVTGSITAHEIYGARGFTAHHNADLWRLSSPVGNHGKGTSVFAFWNMSAAWLCRHLYDQYEYTLDKDFLREEAFPIMKSAAEFLLDIMVEDKDGYLIICPSTSPENSFIYNGETCNISETTTMTMTIAKELFKNCIKCCETLSSDHDFADELESVLKKFYPHKIGSKGQLLEWYEEYKEVDPHHRHISHLFGLHPGNEITIEETPDLAAACKKSLELRGDEGTGWSLGWKINQWARLFNGDRALKLLNRQLRVVRDTGFDYSSGGGTYINMFDAHPPFQIDGNFGATSGIAEMLIQSRENKIFILPALPSTWERGCIKGLRAKGRIKVDIAWDSVRVKITLLSDINQTVMIAVKGTQLSSIRLQAGKAQLLEY